MSRKVWQVTIQMVSDDFETQDEVEERFTELLSEELMEANYVLAEYIGEMNEEAN